MMKLIFTISVCTSAIIVFQQLISYSKRHFHSVYQSTNDSISSNSKEPPPNNVRRLGQKTSLDSVERWRKEGEDIKKEIIQFNIAYVKPSKKDYKSHEELESGKSSSKDLKTSKKASFAMKKRVLDGSNTYCTDPSAPLPCPPTDLPKICDKYNSEGSFKSCYYSCKESFCCVHDSTSETVSPSCSQEVNCIHWAPCYIVWWNFANTIGPANKLRGFPTEEDIQPGDFYDLSIQELVEDFSKPETIPFFRQLFGHFTNDDDLENISSIFFEDSQNWGALPPSSVPITSPPVTNP